MLRSGSTDQLLEFLAQGDMLRLRNVGGQNWEGRLTGTSYVHRAYEIQDTRLHPIWVHMLNTSIRESDRGEI